MLNKLNQNLNFKRGRSMKNKIIIWGYPLHSHTHSYIHAAFFKAFKSMDYDVYWFSDSNYPKNFNFTNCIFWSEGFADSKIPLNKTSIYFIHVAPNPAKYIEAGVKKFIDVRYNHVWHKDHVYSYQLDKEVVAKLGPSVYYEPAKSGIEVIENDYVSYEIASFDKLYITWGANLLPDEFNFNDIFLPRLNKIWFSGTLSKKGRNENYSVYKPFIKIAKKNGIEFIANDPFANPLSEEEVIKRTKNSILGIDLRGPEHLRNGYVPCRVFKSISWGHLGLTNSVEVYNELEGHVLYADDPKQLFLNAMESRKNYKKILEDMKYIQRNHTYINRIQSFLKII